MMDRNKIITLEVGEDSYPTNCYIVYDCNKEAVVIDPGFDFERIINKINEEELVVKAIIITHSHADHFGALDKLHHATKAKIIIHRNDLDGIEDSEKSYLELLNVRKPKLNENDFHLVKEKDILKIGNINFEIINTPGHTVGSICLYEKNLDVLFTGDTLFADCYGRVDLKSGSFSDMEKSLEKLFERFEDVIIYPGHEKSINIDEVKKRIRLLLKIRGN